MIKKVDIKKFNKWAIIFITLMNINILTVEVNNCDFMDDDELNKVKTHIFNNNND